MYTVSSCASGGTVSGLCFVVPVDSGGSRAEHLVGLLQLRPGEDGFVEAVMLAAAIDAVARQFWS